LGILTRDDSALFMGDFAESWEIQTNDENPDVPVGHTRFIFDMIQNATWSDGVPITAEDAAFSMNYYRDTVAFGNPTNPKLTDMTAAYASSPYQLIVEFSTLSYWHINFAGLNTIIPKHIFEDIGLEGWNTWNPIKGADPLIVSGPFTVTDFVAGEFTELTYRADWAYNLGVHPTPTTTTDPPTTPTDGEGPNLTLAIVAGAVGAAVVILVGGFVLLRQK
ncbi:MAG: ABC transporter substrate-binding protein, partial [Candidatus Hodarchaeota archaeon]